MGSLSPRPETELRARGIMPGLALRLEALIGDRVESYATSVEEVGREHITVLMPMRGRVPRAFAAGTVLSAEYRHQGRDWVFNCTSRGATPDQHGLMLSLPKFVEHSERRNAFRLPLAIKPKSIYRVVVDPESDAPEQLTATIVDLSEGGICMSTRDPLTVGEWLGLDFELAPREPLLARMRVVAIDDPLKGSGSVRKVHCAFADIRLADRDRIARFLIKKQLELRRNGQL